MAYGAVMGGASGRGEGAGLDRRRIWGAPQKKGAVRGAIGES